MADDELIIGHRNSEWCGTAPLLEEDLAFSSIAQDKMGHSLQNYKCLETLGEPDPDHNGFRRTADAFRCCQFVELPIGDYAFSLVRHFLFDNAEFIRYEMLKESVYTPLAQFSVKAIGELRYHIMHGDEWIAKLGNAGAEGRTKVQNALDQAIPYALGMFEESPLEQTLMEEGIFGGEKALMQRWKNKIDDVISTTQLNPIDWNSVQPVLGGRSGQHSEYLAPLLEEMGEVINSESVEYDW